MTVTEPIIAPPPRAGAGLTRDKSRPWITAVLLALSAWVLFLPAIRSGYIYYDDVRILKDHPELYGQPSLTADLKAIFVTYFPREEPLLVRDVSWAIDSRIWGFANPVGYHLGNVLLHGIVVALLFAFLLNATRRYSFALAVSVAFLLLAIHTEAVAWIMGRKDLLCAAFMFMALCAQTRRLVSETKTLQVFWYLLTVLCFVAGLLSKISALTFPAVLFLYALLLPYLRGDIPPDAKWQWNRKVWREALLALPPLAVSAVIYAWYQRTLERMGIFDRGYSARGLAHLWNLLVVDPWAFWLYLRQTIFPMHLSLLYTWPALQTSYPAWQIALALATITALLALGIWLFRRHKDLFFYYAAFFILMFPYLNIFYLGIWVADRYFYFAAFCLLALLWSAALALLRRPEPFARVAIVAILAAVIGLNIFQTLSYEQIWRNAERFWQYHIALPHPSASAYDNLASYYYEEAKAQRDSSKTIVPMNKLAIVVDAGLAEFWRDRRQPPPPETFYLFFMKAIIQEVSGDAQGALDSLLLADRLHPGFPEVSLSLSRVYRRLASDPAHHQQRPEYACAARDRFAQYLKLAFRDRPVPAQAKQDLATIEAECRSASAK